jgi:hypothetical protein
VRLFLSRARENFAARKFQAAPSRNEVERPKRLAVRRFAARVVRGLPLTALSFVLSLSRDKESTSLSGGATCRRAKAKTQTTKIFASCQKQYKISCAPRVDMLY